MRLNRVRRTVFAHHGNSQPAAQAELVQQGSELGDADVPATGMHEYPKRFTGAIRLGKPVQHIALQVGQTAELLAGGPG
jgi:hypothetical protein